MRTLDIRHETALPVRELSALVLRSRPEDHGQLIAVGDEDLAVVSAELRDGKPERVRRYDLHLIRGDTQVKISPGFEGVACDGEGTIFLLQEEEARLLVLAADLSRLLHVIPLAVPADYPELGSAWHRKPNSRGEGLLLLDRGHVLIGKQRDDACLIEFGPLGDAPGGIAADTILTPSEPFGGGAALESEFGPLAVWPLAEDTKDALPTINDIALGHDGRVYALSAEARTIARFERHIKPGEQVRATDVWKISDEIPGGLHARPEGLAILPSGSPVVGIDSKRAANNVVVLEPLDVE